MHIINSFHITFLNYRVFLIDQSLFHGWIFKMIYYTSWKFTFKSNFLFQRIKIYIYVLFIFLLIYLHILYLNSEWLFLILVLNFKAYIFLFVIICVHVHLLLLVYRFPFILSISLEKTILKHHFSIWSFLGHKIPICLVSRLCPAPRYHSFLEKVEILFVFIHLISVFCRCLKYLISHLNIIR